MQKTFQEELNSILDSISSTASLTNAEPWVESTRTKHKPDGSWSTRKYDIHGREIRFDNSKGYWSNHIYQDNDSGTLCTYYNSRGESNKRFTDKNSRLIYLEENDEIWYVLVDVGPKLMASQQTADVRVGKYRGSPKEVLAALDASDKETHPAILGFLQEMIEPTPELTFPEKTGFFSRIFKCPILTKLLRR